MNVYLEVQNTRNNTLRRLIHYKPWYERLLAAVCEVFGW